MKGFRSTLRPLVGASSPPRRWPASLNSAKRIAAISPFSSTSSRANSSPAKGVTGGGPPLKRTAEGAPPAPKVHNAKISGPEAKLTPEQQKEVDEHNKEFEKRPDRASGAGDDKVDKKFWSGEGSRE